MRVLVLGGTGFVGRAVVDEAVRRGTDVTVFNRGRAETPEGVTAVVGDRTAPDGLAPLADGEWDIAVDTWSAAPYAVLDAAELLRDRVGHYTYVSSRSVYEYPPDPALAEDAPVVEASPEDRSDVDYARCKRGGEIAVMSVFGHAALLARAGLILGPWENIGRLPWWLNRIARGGKVLAPGPVDQPLQYIDARDLASWIIDAAGRKVGGAYNAVSPSGHTTMGELLETCKAVTGSDAELVWTDPEPIVAAGIRPWMDLPIWLPPGEDHDGMHNGDVRKALKQGLRCRPVGETVADTWAWLQEIGGEAPQRADRPVLGLDPEVEARVLKTL